MTDTPETIRQQMEETKSQLSEKLESLELQVTETVCSTGTAVNATVGAVQETVETVTGAVQDAVQSVSNAFDLQRQIHRHPLLVLGGSVVLGYLAGEFLARSAKRRQQVTETEVPQIPATKNFDHGPARPAIEPAATAAAITAAYESGLQSSAWHQLKGVMFGTLVGMMRDVASRAVPQIVDYLTNDRGTARASGSDDAGDAYDPPMRQETADAKQHLRIVSSDTIRSSNSF